MLFLEVFQINVAVISFTCEAIQENVMKIPSHCYKLLEEIHIDNEIRKELYSLASFTKNEVPTFTAAEFVVLNRCTVTSLLSATTSYFIVTLQINEKLFKA